MKRLSVISFLFLLSLCLGIAYPINMPKCDVHMQSAVGRGPGACLGVVAIVVVAVGTYAVNKVFSDKSGSAFKM